MRFKSLLTILLLFVATLLWAEPITQSTARKKAVIFASKHGKTIAEDVKNLFKVRGKTKAQAMPYYVFNTNDDNGFVIVSGDDRTAEILAYSDKGRFNADEIPDNMRAWLRYYANVIGSLKPTSSVKASSTTLYDNGLREANSAISPLLSCTWNQGSPYYDRCPLVEGRRCYTGCVCTAAVQVMYYHQWPKSATTNISEHSFTYNNRRYTENELTPVVFDWKSMNDSYRDGQSDHSATAVAVLMQYVGQAIKSGYGPDGTGSSFTEVEHALKNNFGYDGNIQHLFRNNYSNEAWESLIYRELAERRPVLYAGTSSGGAHAFVCDGYDGNGLFHINWGWGGMCNGYFKLSVLNPNDNSGMGASSSKDGYSMNQDVLIGIQPPSAHTDNPVATFYSDIDYKGKAVDLPEGEFLLSSLQSYGITNDDISSLKVKSGFKVVVYENDGFGGKNKSYTASTANMGSEWNKQVSSIKIEPNGKSGLSGNFKIMNRNSGKYLDLDNNKTDNNTAIVQFDDEGVDASQTWTFTEVMNGKGVYSICSYGNKNRGMDVVDFSKDNGAQVQLYDYLGNPHQQFILYDCGEGYYQLVARNSGKVVEIPQSSKGNGEWIKIFDNNGTHTQQWAVVENRYDEASAVTLYTDEGYKGKAVTLSEGEYNLSRMGLYNQKDNDMSSLKVTPGFKVTIYEDDNFNGKSKSYTASESFVGEEWNDKMSSLKVEAYGKSGLSGDYKLQNRNSGKFLDLDNNNTDNNTAIVQYDDEYMDATQIWTLTEIGGEKGVYSICTSANKRQGMDVADWSKNDGAQVQLYEYNGHRNQQFIVVEKGDGYYQFVSRLSGKVIEIPNSSKDNGEWIKLYDNNGTNTQQWKFVSPSVYSGIVNTESLSGMNLRKEGNTIIVTGAKGKELTIYDVSGRLIRRETIDSAKYSMSLDKMKAGIYIMKIDSIAKKIRVEL